MKIGTMLMTKIIERAGKMNLRNIELEVIAKNKTAIALYRKRLIFGCLYKPDPILYDGSR